MPGGGAEWRLGGYENFQLRFGGVWKFLAAFWGGMKISWTFHAKNISSDFMVSKLSNFQSQYVRQTTTFSSEGNQAAFHTLKSNTKKALNIQKLQIWKAPNLKSIKLYDYIGRKAPVSCLNAYEMRFEKESGVQRRKKNVSNPQKTKHRD